MFNRVRRAQCVGDETQRSFFKLMNNACIPIKITMNYGPTTSAVMGDFITTSIFEQNGGAKRREINIKHQSYLI